MQNEELSRLNTIMQLQQERAYEQREIERMQARREELLARTVRDERRRMRFVNRLDRELRQARELLTMAEANLIGMGVDIDGEEA